MMNEVVLTVLVMVVVVEYELTKLIEEVRYVEVMTTVLVTFNVVVSVTAQVSVRVKCSIMIICVKGTMIYIASPCTVYTCTYMWVCIYIYI